MSEEPSEKPTVPPGPRTAREEATLLDASAPKASAAPLAASQEDSGELGATTPASAPSLATGVTATDFGRLAQSGVTTAAPMILRVEEHARTMALFRLVILAGLAGIIAAWLPTRPSPGKWVATVFPGFTVLVTAWLLVRFRDPARFDPRKVLFQGVCCVASILAVVYYVGVFSPTIIAMYVGVYFFGQADSSRAGWVIYLTGALGYLGLCVLAVTGVIHLQESVIALHQPELAGLLAVTLVCQVLFAATFWMARRGRAATLAAFERLERAAKQIRKRDALLDEARADLDRERGAAFGRFTDQKVGRYAIGEVIGRGAMGEVYRAWPDGSMTPVAIKFLTPAMGQDAPTVERFFREIEIARKLESDHVVRILEHGMAEGGAPFLVMELLEGHDLAHHLREKKRFGMSEALDLITQVAQALSVADEAGIVHRDLKPQNLFLSETGSKRTWKVLDFGVSKILEGGKDLTMGAAVGTPSYMSPEQARGDQIDHRADVFALGIVAYRVLTGRPAFTGRDSPSTLYNVVHVQPVRPGELARIGEDVERVLALVLAKEKERRFSSAAAFAAALREAARQRLDERWRRDADALIAEHPWGMDLLQVLKREAKSWAPPRIRAASRAS